MNRTRFTAITLACLIGGSVAAAVFAADMDRDRAQDRDRDHVESMDKADRDRLQNRDRDRVVDRDRVIDRDRSMAQDRDTTQQRDQAQDRDRIHADGTGRTIPGATLMTEEERAQYRNRLSNAETEQEREQIRAEHRAMIEERAKSRGVEITATE